MSDAKGSGGRMRDDSPSPRSDIVRGLLFLPFISRAHLRSSAELEIDSLIRQRTIRHI